MRWPWSRNERKEPSPGHEERLSELEVGFRALKRDLDDLDDTLRSVRGRITKRAALEEKNGADAPPESPARPEAKHVTMGELRRTGRWPFPR